jgi:hypothetical protein
MITRILRTHKREIIFVRFLFLFHESALAARLRGQARIDSLQQSLNKETVDTQRVKTLEQLSFEYSSIDPEKGIKFGNEAVALAEKLN